jgi:predicted GNAT superfamily acetyltransferase
MPPILREAAGMEEIRAITALMAEVWGEDFLDPGISRAIQHAGGYVAGAWEGERLVGASLAFLGEHDGERVLHSHATCVAPGRKSEGLGRGMKWHQRAWALGRGIETVEWTYDPLVARNGWFNLTTLGARGVQYEVDFYGRMTTAIERGEESDRCLVRWELRSPKVEAAAAGEVHPLDRAAVDAPVLVRVGDDGAPVLGDALADGPVLAQVAPDIEQLRVDDPDAAAAWRRVLRETLGAAMQAGRHLTAAGRDGWYLDEPA